MLCHVTPLLGRLAATDERVRSVDFSAIAAEHARTIAASLEIKQVKSLLEDQPELAESISTRFAYLVRGRHARSCALLLLSALCSPSPRNTPPHPRAQDPLTHLQVQLLRKFRAGQTDERTLRAIHLSINGLAAGLKSSG